MPRRLFAVWAVFVGLVVGTVGMLMFYGNAMGVNFSIYTALVLVAVIGSALYAGRDVVWRNAWLVVPAVFFAMMVAVRASEWLLLWNVVASLALVGLTLHYIGKPAPFDLSSSLEQFFALVESGVRVVFGDGFVALLESGRWLREQRGGEGGKTAAVLRGLALTVPVLVVFGVLLGSADAVFGTYLGRIQNLFRFDGFEVLFGRTLLALFMGWIAIGAIAYAVLRHWQPDAAHTDDTDDDAFDFTEPDDESLADEEGDAPVKRGGLPFRIGVIESTMLLGGVTFLFGAFVLVQFVYLFGGAETITSENLTYAEYARRGFFELVAVSVLTMGLLLVTDNITVRDGRTENTLFRALSVVVIALVGVMLISAARRMSLYTAEFGLTHLRLWTSVFMGWLVVMFGFLVALLFRVRKNVFSLGVVVSAIGFFVTMNLLNPDALIAEHNINRAFEQDVELDACYLMQQSGDAIPVIAQKYAEAERDDHREILAGVLYNYDLRRGRSYSSYNDNTFFAFNLGRRRAQHAMAGFDAVGYVADARDGTATRVIDSCRYYYYD